jgi:hypothetical protein
VAGALESPVILAVKRENTLSMNANKIFARELLCSFQKFYQIKNGSWYSK